MKEFDISQAGLDIFAAMANIYHALYVINMEDGTFIEIGRAEERVEKVIGGSGNAADSMDAMCRYIVAEDFREDMRQFSDLSTLNERLRDKKWVSRQFPSVNGKWSEGHFIVAGRNEQGDCTKVLWAVRDINKLKQRELAYVAAREKHIREMTALNNSLAEYNDIISNAGLGMWHIILQDGKKPRMQVNAKMAELLAITGQQLTEAEIYSSWYDNILPEALPSVHASVQEMIDGQFSENTYRWRHPQRGFIYVRCGGSAVRREDGTVVLGGYHADVTQIVLSEQRHKQALQKAKMQADEHNAALRRQLDIVNAVAKNFSALYYANLKTDSFIELGARVQTVRQIIGKSGNSQIALDKMCRYLVDPEHEQEMRDFSDLSTLNDRLKKRDWVSRQFLSVRGQWLEGIFIAAERDENGDVENIIWATRDIEETKSREMAYQRALEKAMRDAEAANNAKTTFLFNMSHDIRTPMNAILGYTELLKKNLDDREKCNDYLEKIHSSGDFLLSLINNVLEMARIESGKSNLDEMAQGVLDLHTEIANVYVELMRDKRIEFICSCEVQTPYVYLDKVKLNEIFLNLVSNAYKYTPEGGTITMSVTEVPCDRPGYVNIKTIISDTGIGMSKEYMAVMFEEFSRERTATETKIQGTGLGLPIVKKLIELMEGTVEVESELGKGTTFTVVLPHRIAERPQEISSLPTAETEHSLAGRRILLAEDNELNAEIAMEILREEGLTVDWAADGIICVDMLQKAEPHYYDLILMDIQMPNMDGYKATQVIRQMDDPVRRSIPVVAMTANAFDEDKHNATMAGMNGHLAKPIEVPKLLAVLAEYIR